MAYAPKYDGFGGGWGTVIGGTANPSSSGTATAMGTMQTAALPTQALGSVQGAAFQRQNFGNTAAMATQNIADMQFQTVAPDVMKTQPAGTYANTYDPMATRAPQTQADAYSYGGSGYGGSGCGRPSAYGTQNMAGGCSGSGSGGYGPGGYDAYGGAYPTQGTYGGSGYGQAGAAYGGSGCGQAAYGGSGYGYGGYGYGGPQPGYGGYGGGCGGGCGGAGYGNYGYGGSQGVAPYAGYDRGYGGMNEMAATQQLSAQQVYSREVPGSFAAPGGPGYNAYVSGAGAGFSGHRDQMPMGRKPGRTRRSICC